MKHGKLPAEISKSAEIIHQNGEERNNAFLRRLEYSGRSRGSSAIVRKANPTAELDAVRNRMIQKDMLGLGDNMLWLLCELQAERF